MTWNNIFRTFFFLSVFLSGSLSAQAETYSFPINPPRELNFLDKDEIFRVRNQMIADYPIFFSGDYQADTSPVFNQIVGGKPWWGLRGLICYGPGQLAIEGESDESRFIDNPFLLISMEEAHALVYMKEKGDCPLSYPEPNFLSFDRDRMTFFVEYNASAHEQMLSIIAKSNNYEEPQMKYGFHGRNAIDFGVPYVYATDIRNLHFTNDRNIGNTIYRFRDFIHVGGSCGYPGGCNNGSPHQPETEFIIDAYPASATFKLWRQQPNSPDDPADLIYDITIN